MQFKEHESGQKSPDPRMVKIDKLARLMNVKIHVDGVAYGKITDDEEVITLPEDEMAQVEPVQDAPKPKSAKRMPAKSKKPLDNSEE